MQIITYIAVLFLVVPIIIILINNIIPKQLAKRMSFCLAGAAAIIQIAASTADFFLLPLYNLHEYKFSLLWNLKKPGSEYFAVNSLSLVILFCIGLVSLVSVLIGKHTIDRKKISYVNLLMTLLFGMNGMLIVTDLFSLYVFLEIVGVSS